MFARFFIDRPIFAAVLSILVTLGGIVGYARLPVALYPEITPPTVEVAAIFPGANASEVVNTVASPIEQQVNGVEGMMYMSSTSGNDGSYTLTVTFHPGIDLNIAQVLVQNRVNLAQPVLPDLVKRRGVLVKKKSTGQLMIVNLISPDASRPDLYLSNYATIQLRDELARLEGVGDITFLGQRDYSMRIWLDPEKLMARGLTAQAAVTALEQQNAQVAAGQIGQPPAPTGQPFQYTISTPGRLTDTAQFENVIVKTDVDGRAVRLRDVTSKVELGAVGYDQVCTLDGQPCVALSIYPLPGSNALETARRVEQKLQELRPRFPNGLDYTIVYDTTPFIRESVNEVIRTLLEAVLLVSAVMLLFLQSWRSAIIPLAAVPVAIVGTFGAMAMLGYNLNTLTLFGLVLAVGIVVDDAIVVVEAVEHHLELGLSPRDATIAAMDEVAGPVIAVGLVLAAVFVPCIFVLGIIGQFYQQFAVTIAISTLISTFNSLTLSPALCALLLKPTTERGLEPLPRLIYPIAGAWLACEFLSEQLTPWLGSLESWLGSLPAGWPQWGDAATATFAAGLLGFGGGYLLRVVLNRILGTFFQLFNRTFDLATRGYIRLITGVLRVAPIVILAYGGLVYLTVEVFSRCPVGFIPTQDKGYLLINVQLPDSASLSRTDNVVRQVSTIARSVPGVRHVIAVSGQSQVLGANAPNLGTLFVVLDPFEARHGPALSVRAIAEELTRRTDAEVSAGLVQVFGAPPVEGLGAVGGFKLIIEQRANADPVAAQDSGRPAGGPQLLQAIADDLVRVGEQSPEMADVFTGFRADTPWLELQFDREAAESRGVSVGEVLTTLQIYFGSLYVNDFNRFGRTWQVNVQADQRFRNAVEDPLRVKVANRAGVMIPLGEFVHVEETTGPVMVVRYNLYPSAPVTGSPAPGVSSGRALAVMDQLAEQTLPPDMKAEWTELALLQRQSGNTAMMAFLLSVVLVFLVLAAQYESWALPLAVILVVPMCLLSAAVGVLIAGQDINIFTQIGFVVLIGLACKNAILIVEFARSRYESGLSRREATLEACRLRLRPIIMTSVAFILGVLPLILAEGAGAEMRVLLGTAVFAGMIGVTVFGIVLTPVFFVVIQWLTDRMRGQQRITT
ncbi:MAG: efflux RND transporter permease subunit [Bacteroidales bacterium]|nr:efflux RND transporter permease subunit [Bacteroidales bacterium]